MVIGNRAIQMFDYRGYHNARFFFLPYTPALPPGAANARVVILDDRDPDYERLTLDEMRAAWRKGWIESGADPAKCDEIFESIREIHHPPRGVAERVSAIRGARDE